MNQIGLSIAGRNPGFTVFMAVNWTGPRLEDLPDTSLRVNTSGEQYYTVSLTEDFATCELNLRRFVNGGREDVFRIAIRIPARTAIIDVGGNTVSPKQLLDSIKDEIVNRGTIFYRAGIYRFPDGIAYPSFPEADLQQILNAYTLIPAWGRTYVMTGTEMAFVDISDDEISQLMERMPLWSSIQQYGEFVFGQAANDVLPRFAPSQEELSAHNAVTVYVRQAGSGITVPEVITAGRTFKSSEAGYDVRAYEEVEYTLSAAKVLECWRHNDLLPEADGVSAVLDVAGGCVTLDFRPKPLEKVFTVKLLDADGKLSVGQVLTDLTGHGMEPVSEGGYRFEGEHIIDFEGGAIKNGWLAGHFMIPEDTHFQLVGASLMGSEIRLTVKEVKVEKKKAPEFQHAGAAGQTANILNVFIAPALKTDSGILTIEYRNGTELIVWKNAVNFVKEPARPHAPAAGGIPNARPQQPAIAREERLYALVSVPAAINLSQANVYFGIPPKYAKMRPLLDTETHEYSVTIDGKSNVVGGFKRFMELFAVRYTDGLSTKQILGRLGGIFMIALILVLFALGLGFFAGKVYSENIAETDVPEATVVETTVDDDNEAEDSSGKVLNDAEADSDGENLAGKQDETSDGQLAETEPEPQHNNAADLGSTHSSHRQNGGAAQAPGQNSTEPVHNPEPAPQPQPEPQPENPAPEAPATVPAPES